MTTSRPELVNEIEERFRQLNWRGRHQFARRLEAFGLTVPQYLALAKVQHLGPDATMSEVSDALQLPRSSMTSITDRLVEQGLVLRGSLEHDRRAVSATITEKGRALVKAVEATRTADLTRLLEGLSEDDLARFARTLDWLLGGMDRLSPEVDDAARHEPG